MEVVSILINHSPYTACLANQVYLYLLPWFQTLSEKDLSSQFQNFFKNIEQNIFTLIYHWYGKRYSQS